MKIILVLPQHNLYYDIRFRIVPRHSEHSYDFPFFAIVFDKTNLHTNVEHWMYAQIYILSLEWMKQWIRRQCVLTQIRRSDGQMKKMSTDTNEFLWMILPSRVRCRNTRDIINRRTIYSPRSLSSFEDLFQFVRLSFDAMCNRTLMIRYFKSEEQDIFLENFSSI